MEVSDPRELLETFKQNDAYNQLLTFTESLVTKVTDLSAQLEQATGDLEDQNKIRRDWKRRAERAENATSRNPFTLVLIDGDGYIFKDNYLKNTQSGGGEAAHHLLSAVRDCIKAAQLQELSLDQQILVNVYANRRGLTGALLEAGIISHPNDLEEFFCKFNQSQAHFQFIDCGAGKERVDAKLRETYRFFLQNCQCKLIFLALCHDNGYIAELDKYRNDVLAKKKTWLVDHYAKGRAFVNPPFHMVKLDNVFDNRAISVKRLTPSYLLNTNSFYCSTAVPSFTTEKVPIPEQSPYSNPPPHFISASGASPVNATRYDSNREMVEKHDAPYLAPGVEPPTSGDEVPVACLSQDTITRKNRSGQRIDDPIQPPWPVEQQHFEARIHQRKLCNEYYLRGYCPDRNCRFDHSPIDKELEKTLRFTARKVVCRSGAACRRADCYYGHRCPFASCDRRRCPFAKAGLHEVTDLEIVAFASSGGGGG